MSEEFEVDAVDKLAVWVLPRKEEGLTLSVRSTVRTLLGTRYPDAAVRSALN